MLKNKAFLYFVFLAFSIFTCAKLHAQCTPYVVGSSHFFPSNAGLEKEWDISPDGNYFYSQSFFGVTLYNLNTFEEKLIYINGPFGPFANQVWFSADGKSISIETVNVLTGELNQWINYSINSGKKSALEKKQIPPFKKKPPELKSPIKEFVPQNAKISADGSFYIVKKEHTFLKVFLKTVCIENSKIPTLEIGSSCFKSSCPVEENAFSEKQSQKSEEKNLIRKLQEFSNFNPEKDLPFLIAALENKNFLNKYPDLISSVMQTVLEKSQPLFDRLIHDHPDLSKQLHNQKRHCGPIHVCRTPEDEKTVNLQIASYIDNLEDEAKNKTYSNLDYWNSLLILAPAVQNIPERNQIRLRESIIQSIVSKEEAKKRNIPIQQVYREKTKTVDSAFGSILWPKKIEQHSQNAKALYLHWHCPTSTNSGLPENESIVIWLDENNKTIDAHEFDLFLGSALNLYPEIDYSQCAFSAFSKFEAEAPQWLIENDLLNKLLHNRLANIISSYASSAYYAGGLPPVLPGEELINPDLNAERKLASLSISGCRLIEEAKILSNNILNELIKLLPSTEPSCKNALIHSITESLLDSTLDDHQCRQNPKACKKSQSYLAKVLKKLSLANLASFDPFLSNPENTSECFLDYYLSTPEKALHQMNSFITKLHETMSCNRLVLSNTSKKIEGNMGTSIQSHYTLRRLEDQKASKSPVTFEAVIRYKFIDSKGDFDLNLQKEYEQKVRECFEKVENNLTGPNGEILHLKLFADSNTKTIPENAIVEISSDIKRSDSKHWTTEASCPMIIHESLHILGLVDGYKETASGVIVDGDGNFKKTDINANYLEYDCRNLAPEDSIMRDPDLAFKNLDEGKSLLYPAEFRAITEPGCLSVNKTYYICSQDSYQTSRGAYGSKASGCSTGLPKACSNPTEWVK